MIVGNYKATAEKGEIDILKNHYTNWISKCNFKSYLYRISDPFFKYRPALIMYLRISIIGQSRREEDILMDHEMNFDGIMILFIDQELFVEKVESPLDEFNFE